MSERCDWCTQEAVAGINEVPGATDRSVLDVCPEHALVLGTDLVEVAILSDGFTDADAIEIEIETPD